MTASPSRRELYRIVYPESERPALEVGTTIYDVIDVSERGLRFQLNHQRAPQLGDRIVGLLHFRRGESTRIEGSVIRLVPAVVAIALNPPLAFSEMMMEQRYLRSKGFLLRG